MGKKGENTEYKNEVGHPGERETPDYTEIGMK